MIVNLKELAAKGSPVELKGSFDLTDLLHEREGISVPGKLEVDLTAQTRSGLTVVEGTIRLPFEAPCSRCLSHVKETIPVSFREVFAQKPEVIPKEDLDEVHLVSEDQIKLEPYLEEAVWLALPFAPVCREDCKGLCPECGTDRNNGTCGCKTEKIDPRLAGLADFFKE